MILQLREEAEKAEREILAPVRQGLQRGRSAISGLDAPGRTEDDVFARALGIEALPRARKRPR